MNEEDQADAAGDLGGPGSTAIVRESGVAIATISVRSVAAGFAIAGVEDPRRSTSDAESSSAIIGRSPPSRSACRTSTACPVHGPSSPPDRADGSTQSGQ